jgi:hypothetical protein
MWDVRLVPVLEAQDDLVAWWQLRAIGWSRAMIEQHSWDHRWRSVHRGVYALSRAPLTQRQRWIAAVLTAPGTFLAGLSAAACWGFHEWDGRYETVVRPGSGGRRRYPGLLVARSSTLTGQTTRSDGIPIVTAERALIDLAARPERQELARAFRESIRLRCTTADGISKVLAGQRGTAVLAALCDRYATIPYHRCRSDAEGRALEVLHDAGVEPPAVNVQVNGPRPDFTWRRHKLIIEVDGSQFHQFVDEDARKQARWEAAGYRVRRITSDDVYSRPERLVALYRSNVPHAVP